MISVKEETDCLKLKPKLKERVVIIESENKNFFYLYDSDSESIYIINHTGKRILELCNGKRSIEDIANILRKEFNVDLNRLLTSLYKFIKEASRRGVVST